MRSVVAFLLIVSLLVSTPMPSSAASCSEPEKTAPGLELIEEAFNFLVAFFVEPLPTPVFLEAAAAGVQQEVARARPDVGNLDLGAIESWAGFAEVYCQFAVETDSSSRIAHSAIRAMTTAADEGHTRFLGPDAYSEYRQWQTGDARYEGIGTRLRSDPLGVQYVFPGSPAEEAGLRFGDQIMAIDGEPAADMAAADAVQLIRGESGSVVLLTINREGHLEPFDVEIARAAIRVPITEARRIDEIGYLHIQSFPGSGLLEEVTEALASFEDQGLEGLVLDLRSNGGGRLDVGTTIAALFLPEGTPVYRQTTRRGAVTTKTVSTGATWLKPVTVLVDDGTASMGEILASALQEQASAKVIGTTTAGSVAGSILIPLSDGSALQVTTLRLDSGLGRVLNNIGVRPDIEVEPTIAEMQAGVDRALDVAISELRGQLRLKVLAEEYSLGLAA